MEDGFYRPARHPDHLRLIGAGIAVGAVLISLAGGSPLAALNVISATFGFYAMKALSWTLRSREWLKRVSISLAVVCSILACLAIAGLLPELALHGYRIWWPLFGFLVFSLLSMWLGYERSREADKFSAILALYPPPDGGEWDARKMKEATDGEVSVNRFEQLLNRGSSIGLSEHELVAMSLVMDFPSELWNRSPEWWESIIEERERGVDVVDRLREWDCYTLEQAAEELNLSTDEVHRMVQLGELESRTGIQGDLQIRAANVDEKLLLKDGVPRELLIPWNKTASSNPVGNGRYPDRTRRTGQFADRHGRRA